MNKRRVVVTGIGAVTPLGLSSSDLWSGLLEGRCGIRKIRAFDASAFPCQLAGEVAEYNIRDYVPKSYRKATKLMSRDIELSVIAADEAIRNSGLITKAAETESRSVPPERFAISFGAGLISCDMQEIAPCIAMSLTDGRFDIRKWGKDGMQALTPLWLLKYLPNMLPCHIGIIHDIQGPSNTITCGETAGHIAVAEAAEMIARGDADAALAGGCEAKVNPIVMLRQCLLKRSAENANDTPEQACRPFDADAGGSVFGEAGGVLVLEELQAAVCRKAPIAAELVGAASSNNLNADFIHLESDGKGLQIAIRKALEEAHIRPEQIDLIIPTGTGIAADDRAEAAALEAVFGSALQTINVWPIKSMVSHTGAAAGVVDLIAAVLAIQHGTIGPAVNFSRPADGCRLKIHTKQTTQNIRFALCCGYSFGGQTAAVVIKKYEDSL
ncbi:MAG TPA: beta-ketoacyl-[acyl-carrier-protein] synthase family protein [Anaerohalosphaeraceae bacterium]|nr:beta-ketoacyl-[acyl-carrier-protein] synthase family protein [Anaerohalosphaeraceae bacterium]HOL31591.1 beta-ketoacyl-[acyl-carrier-protein] synthase family protein [Anaerohalosphaeraceae bacterium]HOM75582.1 beta-ketoacyl-[acyl-carrier-protein] synthase family protein [Anaerohalosphaeraceae bacterium]HPC63510.1 beta-ketoacyl-[acyl-carrier-protein] synthase family protein [Anaerohalosphaeraceae bacterium]HPO69956.1 beta-ketoacyl-[acyl-carrier-protein] synthase family protein [Anaerohalospha